jgi:hypothetical protein
MKRTLVRLATLSVALLVFGVWLVARKTHAQPQLGFGEPLCISSVPIAWGQFKGGSQQAGFAFQDTAGTLRFITNVPCNGVPQIALEIHRTK